jgi:hypothetical protein
MNFSIRITNSKPKKIWGQSSLEGQIQFGDYSEGFDLPLVWWTREDYERQWKNALERFKTEDTTCFVTSIQDPRVKPFIDWWILYKVKSKVYIQNCIVLAEIYRESIGIKPFTVDTCYNYIPPLENCSEETFHGWVIPL